MGELGEAFYIAVSLVLSFDAELYPIVFLSLKVSLTAVVISCALGFSLGAVLASTRFRGRGFIIAILNAFMGLPPVVVGLIVYLMLSRSGPLGMLGLLYTPSAMIIAQIILITPLIAALSFQVLSDLQHEYDDFFNSLRLTRQARIRTILWEARAALATVALAGLGRAISEVGAVMIVGGNINHATRIMTTAIALETSKGTLSLALALGIILITLSVAINASVMLVRSSARERAYA